MYVCKECNTEIRHRNNVSRHLKVCKVKKVQKQKYSCGIFEKIFLFKSKLERHIVTHSRPNFECQYCSKSFKREDHYISHQTHSELCIPTISTILTMVAMLQYDRSEVRVEGSVDVSEQEVPDLDIQIETESIVNDSFFDIVNVENKIPTPPRRQQNRLVKTRERKVFDLNKILEKVEAKEKEKIFKKSLESSSSHMHEFTEATLKYFRQLIKNARRSFASKVEGAKILERIFGERLHDIDFQLWLVEKFWLKGREELLLFLEFASNGDIFTPRDEDSLVLKNVRECMIFGNLIQKLVFTEVMIDILLRLI